MSEQKERRQWVWIATTLIALSLGLGALAAQGTSVSCEVPKEPIRLMTPSDVTKIMQVVDVALSPGGEHIAYVLQVQREPGVDEDGPAYRELHVSDPEGYSRPFVTGKVNLSKVRGSPDGRRITSLAKRFDDKHKSLYAIAIDGGESRRVVGHETAISDYAFSPDGGRVAFLAKEKRDKAYEAAKEQGYNAKVYEEEPRFTRLWFGELERGLVPKDAKPTAVSLEGSVSTLSFSPSGEAMALSIAPTSSIDDHYMKRQVHLFNVETKALAGKLETQGKIGAARFSPSGDKIAMIASADLNDPSSGRLMVGSAEGGALTPALPVDAEEHVSDFDWLDDDTLVFLSGRGVQTVVGTVKADGSNASVLVGPEGPVFWRLSVSRKAKRAALVGDSPTFPAEAFIADLERPGPAKRLTAHNPWLKEIHLGRQEAVTYTARDGLEIGGILIHPAVKAPESERVPLLLVVHGGPESHVRNGWVTGYSRPGQTGAAKGWAVFYPNYRGSTGRGVDFSKKGQADYAGAEFDDLVDAIAHFDAQGLIDPKKVGITGGSYGGFASAWGATKLTEHFAASVMFVGITNQISKAGTTDIPNEMFLVHSRRWPWEHWDWFRERSPIHYVEQARTPILIMHGEQDTRVHPSQSLELYRYLKLVDKTPARLVLYPNEGHGNRKAAARFDYSLRQLRWFEHYLAGPGGAPPPHPLDHSKALNPESSEECEEGEEGKGCEPEPSP